MWQIDNRTPFAAGATWVRDAGGREIWIVAVKATFTVHPGGQLVLAADQLPVLIGPKHRGLPGKSSLRYESDLVLTKVTTDIVVNGVAHAPPGTLVSEMDVSVRVGSVQKTLRVFGDRRWHLGRASSPQPFERMPIVYERAFGGGLAQSTKAGAEWDERNPVGTGFAASEAGDDSPPPNVEYPAELIRSWRERPRPAGLTPIEGHWRERVRWAGTYDDRWVKERLPLPPLDFDSRFFQCVPPDQQTSAFLVGGEQVVLKGLVPAGELTFALPVLAPVFESRFTKGPKQRHGALLHTVLLDSEGPRVSLVFHTALPCSDRGDFLDRTVVTCDWDSLAKHELAANPAARVS